MSTLAELIELGKSLGYEDEDLKRFVKAEQDFQREERKNKREKRKELQQQELEKLRLQASLPQGIVWIACKNGSICDKPIAVDKDKDYDMPLVAAACHEGGLIPGVLCRDNKYAIIPWGCLAIPKREYYLLTNPGGLDLLWESDSKGKVPLGAIRGGKSEHGEDLYIGRVKMDCYYLSGKVHPSHNTCYIPYDREEKHFGHYEVLCVKSIPVSVKY